MLHCLFVYDRVFIAMYLKEALLILLYAPRYSKKYNTRVDQNTSEYFQYSTFYSMFYQFPPGTIRMTMGRLVQEGFVSQLTRNDTVFTFITSSGMEFVEQLIARRQQKWDGIWRVVVITTPSEEYEAKLLEAHMAEFSRHVFISPLAINQQLDKRIANLIEAKSIQPYDHKTLANKLWHIEKLMYKYTLWMSEASRDGKNTHKILSSYIQLVKSDPRLPSGLLPVAWPAEKAEQILWKYIQKQLRNRKR
jgi:DNA-binding transcriptional regulator PaaX